MRALIAVLATLATAPAAFAGGWATVELSSTPDGVDPGGTWTVDVRVLQHGRTPLEGVRPSVIVIAGRERVVADARPTGRPGIYRAAVRIPDADRFRYLVDDGFGQRHSYPPVVAGGAAGKAAPAAPASDEGTPWAAIALAVAAGLAAAGLLVAGQRRRPARPTA